MRSATNCGTTSDTDHRSQQQGNTTRERVRVRVRHKEEEKTNGHLRKNNEEQGDHDNCGSSQPEQTEETRATQRQAHTRMSMAQWSSWWEQRARRRDRWSSHKTAQQVTTTPTVCTQNCATRTVWVSCHNNNCNGNHHQNHKNTTPVGAGTHTQTSMPSSNSTGTGGGTVPTSAQVAHLLKGHTAPTSGPHKRTMIQEHHSDHPHHCNHGTTGTTTNPKTPPHVEKL
jgi:hypothetical protein